MEPSTGRKPTVARRLTAVLLAIVVGAAGPALGLLTFGRSSSLWGLAGVGIAWAGASLAGVVLHDFVLRRGGAELAPPRTPRNLSGVAAWGAGVILGPGPAIVLLLPLVLSTSHPIPGTEPVLWVVAVLMGVAWLASPTLGMLITRGLCRRWAAPPPSSPPTPAGSPAPAPTPLPARPADDPPALPFLPSPA